MICDPMSVRTSGSPPAECYECVIMCARTCALLCTFCRCGRAWWPFDEGAHLAVRACLLYAAIYQGPGSLTRGHHGVYTE